METKSIRCPSCGAIIISDNPKTVSFCQYCGTRIKENEELRKQILQQEHEIEIEKLHHQQDKEMKKYESHLNTKSNIQSVLGDIFRNLSIPVGHALKELISAIGIIALGLLIVRLIVKYMFGF